MPDIHIGEAGVLKLLNNINSHKATGPDGIPARLLHEYASYIAPPPSARVRAMLSMVTDNWVSQERLDLKLCCLSLRMLTLQWTKDFLNNRLQQVLLDGQTLTTAEVLSGVPQGTVLGPLLFRSPFLKTGTIEADHSDIWYSFCVDRYLEYSWSSLAGIPSGPVAL
jgi:hypothetical protein